MNCNKCYGTGTLVATDKKTKAIFGFLCPCGIWRAKGLSVKIPQWNDKKHHRFFDADFSMPQVFDPKQMVADQKDPKKELKKIEENKPASFNDDDIPW